jgi:hypothetical protein
VQIYKIGRKLVWRLLKKSNILEFNHMGPSSRSLNTNIRTRKNQVMNFLFIWLGRITPRGECELGYEERESQLTCVSPIPKRINKPKNDRFLFLL